ncbi:hypothetical protein Plhal304r1_c031g0101371 [Plasmopara halstedii]
MRHPYFYLIHVKHFQTRNVFARDQVKLRYILLHLQKGHLTEYQSLLALWLSHIASCPFHSRE